MVTVVSKSFRGARAFVGRAEPRLVTPLLSSLIFSGPISQRYIYRPPIEAKCLIVYSRTFSVLTLFLALITSKNNSFIIQMNVKLKIGEDFLNSVEVVQRFY